MPADPLKRWKPQIPAFAPDKVLAPLLEPILHPSQWRIQALGLTLALGHPLFYVLWAHWFAQPYESLWQRLLMGLLGLALVTVPSLRAQPPSRWAAAAFSTIFWITLPVYFTWMYLCNERNAVWFATLSTMFLIYYHLTDWRIATLGLASGLPAGWALFTLLGPAVPAQPLPEQATHWIVFLFAWSMGMMLGMSSSNLRREQLKRALGTMGIMAHELRTPLATMALIGDAFSTQAHGHPALEGLTERLHATVRNMNRQIDMQITNAQLMRLSTARARISADALVRRAAQGFPYRSARERACVQIHLVRDFEFRSCEALFTQVIENLVKNALRALAAMPEPAQPGDLCIEIGIAPQRPRHGRIRISDRGPGIDPRLRTRLFQPFVSTHQVTGHGLGLAFCQRVVHEAGGSIRVESEPNRGARFIIELPLAVVPSRRSAP